MVKSVHEAPRPDDPVRFRHYWLAETIRLRESQWGPLQDNAEIRRARALGNDFAQRLLLRARFLSQREGLDTTLQQWVHGARLAFFILLLLAILAGVTAAAGALGDGGRQVNLVLALAALLGLHALTFLFWCVGGLLPADNARTGLGDLWLWLTRKLARGPQAALAPRALAGLLARHRALRPLLGGVSHALWSVILAAMLITLLALLSARRYTFSWETTLLSPDTFVTFTRTLGWLPSKLGFSIPPEAIIRASDGLQQLPDTAHAQWSGWLIGCLVCYGLLPRLVALAATVTAARHRIGQIRLDTSLPGYIELRDRLDPVSVAGSIDAPAPRDIPGPAGADPATTALQTGRAIVGLELARDQAWPPVAAPLDPQITDLGIIDDRTQRRRLLDMLAGSPPEKLLIVCDGHQTPDRGSINLISELVATAQHARVLLVTPPGPRTPERGRVDTWNQHLQRAGLSVPDIAADAEQAIAWLVASPADRPQPDSAS